MTYGLSCRSWRYCSEIEHYVKEVKELHNNVMQRECSPGWLKLVFSEVGNMLQSMGNVKCKDIALDSRETNVTFSEQMACYLRIINSINMKCLGVYRRVKNVISALRRSKNYSVLNEQ